ncbi:MAG: DUF1045 domain-containing protein [Pseudomonadota bacterium]
MYDAFSRYALYWVPTPELALSRFGLDWTGWCAESGEHIRRRPIAGIAQSQGLSAGGLSRHGLHGVLAAPFSLAPGRNVWALEQAVDHVAGTSAAIRVAQLRPAMVGQRIALVPHRPIEMLDGLIGRVRAGLYGLTALEPADERRGRRSGFGLGPAKTGSALSSDRFHIPLTDPIVPERIDRAMAVVEALLERLRLSPFRIADLALMGDPGGGRPLRILRRYGLSGSEAEISPFGGLETRGPQLLAGLVERRPKSQGFCFG